MKKNVIYRVNCSYSASGNGRCFKTLYVLAEGVQDCLDKTISHIKDNNSIVYDLTSFACTKLNSSFIN